MHNNNNNDTHGGDDRKKRKLKKIKEPFDVVIYLFMFPVIIIWNSSKLIMPSPLPSTPAIIFRHSSMEHASPRLAITILSSSAVMEPLPSRSKMEKASFRFSKTSSGSTSLVFNSVNSSKLMWPSPSESTSRISFFSSSSVAGWPRLFIMEPSSEAEIFPSPFASNFLKTYSRSSITEARDECNDTGGAWGNEDEDDIVFRSFFFFMLKRDLKPMINLEGEGELENGRDAPNPKKLISVLFWGENLDRWCYYWHAKRGPSFLYLKYLLRVIPYVTRVC